MLGVVGMSFEPIERVPGHFQRQVVARHGPQPAGCVDHERDSVDVLLVTEPRIDVTVNPDDPVEPPLLPITHDLVEASETMASIIQELVPAGLVELSIRGRGPGHTRLVDERLAGVGAR